MENKFVCHQKDGLCYFTISSFDRTRLVRHGFSTRLGGVSTGKYNLLNLGIKKNDDPSAVRDNFRIICDALEIKPENMVFTDQVHRDRIRFVTERDRGKGFFLPSDITETDGLITNVPQVALVTFYADCVPLFFIDIANKAIGLAHSGWRGTVSKIGAKLLDAMNSQFGTKPENCLAGIGPSIGPCCFEVDEPVADEFKKAFSDNKSIIVKSTEIKYHIDLWAANRILLEEAGILTDNITVASICTCCNKDIFFSHRGDKGRTGSLAAFLMLI